jgi:hypothetical protein
MLLVRDFGVLVQVASQLDELFALLSREHGASGP